MSFELRPSDAPLCEIIMDLTADERARMVALINNFEPMEEDDDTTIHP